MKFENCPSARASSVHSCVEYIFDHSKKKSFLSFYSNFSVSDKELYP